MRYIFQLTHKAESPRVTIYNLNMVGRDGKIVFSCYVAAENPNKVQCSCKVIPYSGTNYKDVFIMVNGAENITKDRGLLFHPGNFWYNNRGCFLTGDDYELSSNQRKINDKGKKVYWNDENQKEYAVIHSRTTFAKLKEAVNYPDCEIDMVFT